MFNGITPAQLVEILAAVEPVELQGLALLKRRRPQPGQWHPTNINTHTLAKAASEMIDYIQRCEKAAKNLVDLPPIPLDIPIEEWPL